MNEIIGQYLAKIGKRGGKARTPEKIAASRANQALAVEARRKYKPCPNYPNHSHRFSKATGKCYGCGYRKPKS